MAQKKNTIKRIAQTTIYIHTTATESTASMHLGKSARREDRMKNGRKRLMITLQRFQ